MPGRRAPSAKVRLEEALEFLLRHGFRVEVALAVGAAEAAQERLLLWRLDALGEDVHAEAAAELDDAFEDGGGARISLRREEDGAVNLHRVHRERLEHGDGAVARASSIEVA